MTLEGGAAEGVWSEPLTVKPAALESNQAVTIPFEKAVPITQRYSQPYWLVKPPAGDVYQVDDQMLIGLPDTPPVASMRLKLTVEGTPIEISRPVQYRYAPRAEGERVRLLSIVPAVAVNQPATVSVFPQVAARKVQVAVRANVPNAAGDLRLDLPAGWKAVPHTQPFKVAAVGEEDQLTFEVTPPAAEATATLKAIATVNGREVENGMDTISYPHLRPQTLCPRWDAKLVRA